MGVFDHTCALTRTSISGPEPVLLLALHWKDRHLASNYELSYMLRRSKTRDLNELFRFYGTGDYDDRGTVDEFDHVAGCPENDRWWNYQFLCHLDAVTQFMGCSYQQADDKLDFLETFVEQCSRARVELFGHNLLGEQLFDQEELDLQNKLHRVTGEMLLRKQHQLAERDE